MVLLVGFVGRMEGRVLANYHYYSNSNARELVMDSTLINAN